jgi:hypothetical protein
MKEPARNPWFFHENGRFFEFLEIARTGGSSICNFSKNHNWDL